MKTTLSQIRSHSPCLDGWQKLLKHLGKTQADDEELSLLTILESNGLDNTLWCLIAVEGFYREKRLYAVWCASQFKHLMGPASLKALEVAAKFANGEATEVELRKARVAATAENAEAELRNAWAEAWAAAAAAWTAWTAVWETEAVASWAAAEAAGAAAAAEAVEAAATRAAAATLAAAAAATLAAAEAVATLAAAEAVATLAVTYSTAYSTAILKQEQELKRVLECTEAGKDPYPRSST